MSHIDFMVRALNLALRGKGHTSPNPMVGAVIVKNNKIVTEGWHRRCGSDHAEIVALKKAGPKARGATLYVTLEPCYHFGRTPPCVDAIIERGIKKIYIAMEDPNLRTSGKSIRKLKKAGVATEVGLLKEESQKINEVYLKYIDNRMPFIVAKSAQTLDGKIATSLGHSQWITSKETRRFSQTVRDEFDAILVGINTVLKDNPSLNGIKKTKALKKIILDSSLRISPRSKLISNSASSCIVATTVRAPKQKIQALRAKGVDVMVCPSRKGRVHLSELFKELAKREIASILLEGGAQTIGSALKENLVDKMHIYIAPKIVGDDRALSSVVGLKILDINKTISLQNMIFQKIGKDILVTAYVLRNR